MTQTTKTARLRPGMRIYCIGDIHGRADLLAHMQERIAADLKRRPNHESLIIYLGDYIDRGPQSAQVLDLLAKPAPAPHFALRGNHETMMLDFLRDMRTLDIWRRLGGMETLVSYGIDVSDVAMGLGYEEARQTLLSKLPERHLNLLKNMRLSLEVGDYFFCHAGVRPGIALEAQSEVDLTTIRHDFLGSDDDFGRIVIHGHTPVAEPEIKKNRINIDTGAFASGRLTCLVIEPKGFFFLPEETK
jgi:serine/threonine protein phosphatase 1